MTKMHTVYMQTNTFTFSKVSQISLMRSKNKNKIKKDIRIAQMEFFFISHSLQIAKHTQFHTRGSGEDNIKLVVFVKLEAEKLQRK